MYDARTSRPFPAGRPGRLFLANMCLCERYIPVKKVGAVLVAARGDFHSRGNPLVNCLEADALQMPVQQMKHSQAPSPHVFFDPVFVLQDSVSTSAPANEALRLCIMGSLYSSIAAAKHLVGNPRSPDGVRQLGLAGDWVACCDSGASASARLQDSLFVGPLAPLSPGLVVSSRSYQCGALQY